MSDTDPDVISRLTDPDAVDLSRTGGKGANLAALVRAGLPIPAGFVVSTSVYRDFVREHRLDVLIRQEMAHLDDHHGAVDAASQRLRRAFEVAENPADVREAITAAYTTLGEGPVAVRSSATAEDLPEASFAGQQDTVLNVVGASDLCDAVRRCWSSLWTARAIAYRRRHDIEHERVAVAVVVQRMVPADVAGVLFTADPVSGRRDHIVIEAAAGLGEAVVSGRVSPDRWTIDARTHAVLSGPDDAAPSLLTPDQLHALVGLGSRAADVFGIPQDIEWAVCGGRCWLLQSRPITSLFPLPPASAQPGLRVYIPVMLVAQGVVEPFTPAGNVFFRAMAGAWIRYLSTGSRRPEGEAPPWLPIVAGRIYLDATPLLQRRRLAAKVISSMRMKDPDASAVLHDWLAKNSARLPRPQGRSNMRGLVAWVPKVLSGVVMTIVAPDRTRRRLLTAADEQMARLEQEAAALSSPLEQVEFVDRILPVRTCDLVVDQLPAVYAEELAKVVAERLLERWLGTSAGFEPARRWLPHDPTVAMGAELARLARDHAAAGTEPSPTSPEVAEFLAAYGHRAPDREIDLGLPRLADDPTYVVELIRGYIRSGEPRQALARFQTGSAQAQAAAAESVASVRRAKGPLRALVLRSLLDRYRELGGLREQPKFDMVRAIALGQRTLRRTGATLVANGLLEHADDVFFLDAADVRAVLADECRDLRALVAANRREYERELSRRAVPRILVSDGETVYGPAARPVTEKADLLVGTAISPGVHEGVVRMLDSPVGAGLVPGEVLVAASTDPGWTPLFLLAGALVMEVGGVVSHGAVVAREYGIPAVAGIADATTRLRTGQRVRVDGGNGRVTLLEPAGEAPAPARQETVRGAAP
jgi:pyruvate,water dikinase